MLLLLPLAVWHVGGPAHALEGLPPGFLHFKGGPYGWLYLSSFSLIVLVSYNATWALAQKYYSVPDEKSASKAAYLSAALNFVGTPLMLLPAIIGRKLLPDLLAQGRTADTYVLLVLKLLPAGVIGIIVAAMFSATMAAISSDLNAIASVLTRDVYLRLLNRDSSERRLVRVGRLSTLALGAIVIALSLWIATEPFSIVVSPDGDGLWCVPGADIAAGTRRANDSLAYLERSAGRLHLGLDRWNYDLRCEDLVPADSAWHFA